MEMLEKMSIDTRRLKFIKPDYNETLINEIQYNFKSHNDLESA